MSTPNPKSNLFNAADSALGYIYQCRYALWLLLKRGQIDASAEISIERLDDIAFDRGTSQERLQTKHSITRKGNLTDASADLWKTLRVWSEGVIRGQLTIPGSILCLVTTAAVSDGSIASLLLPKVDGYIRDEATAQMRLEEVVRNTRSQQKELVDSHNTFMRLSSAQRSDLIRSVYILAEQPNIIDLGYELRGVLKGRTHPEHLDGMCRRVEGWWFDRVVQHLAGEVGQSVIRATDLDDVIQNIRDTQRKRDLPLNWCFAQAPDAAPSVSDDRVFVKQLRVVDCNDSTVSEAVCDHYKASQERSQWIRERLLFMEDWNQYDLRLVEEWRRHFNYMVEDLSECTDQEVERKLGRTFYRETQDRQVLIRPDNTYLTVMRGALHRLADNSKVGWHPRWSEMFPSSLSEANKHEGEI